MTRVLLTPLTQHAKNRVREHGNIMTLLRRDGDMMLVESLEKTWRGERWSGWFVVEVLDKEIDFEVLDK